MTNDRGSEWGQWDLQVQTIIDDGYVSLDTYANDLKKEDSGLWNEYVGKVGGETNALLFDSRTYFNDSKIDIKERMRNYSRNLVAFVETYRPEIRALLVTDHNYDHDELIDSLVKYAEKAKIKIIPGVEINVNGIHILAYFDTIPYKKSTFSDGIKTFQSKIGIHTKLNDRGALSVTQAGILEVIDEIKKANGSLIYPHCNSDNGLFQERQKADRENLADIFNYADSIVLQTQNKKSADELKKYIAGSKILKKPFAITIAPDSRRLGDIGRPDTQGNFQWIKADPSFKGLTQILTEPEDRVFIGVQPLKLESVERHRDKYIKSIEVRHKTGIKTAWFDQAIDLNPGLIAIIGKKGSGKSALTDILGLAGSSNVDRSNFSFLTQKKFLKRNLGAEYVYRLTWEDDTTDAGVLSREIDPAKDPERVKYLPQKYVESICDEFGVSRTFQDEIDRVIFSYVPTEKRLERTNLKDLLAYKDQTIDKSIMGLKIKLSELNIEISGLEAKTKPSYAEYIDKKLDQREQALKNLAAPKVVPKPKKSGASQKKIEALNGQIQTLDKDIKTIENNLTTSTTQREKLRSLESQIGILRENVSTFLADFADTLTEFGIEGKKLVDLKVDSKQLDSKQKQLDDAIKKYEMQLDKLPDPTKKERNFVAERAKLITERDELKGKLNEGDVLYQNYTEAVAQHKEQQQAIVGKADDATLNTIESLKAEKKYIAGGLAKDIQAKKKDRDGIVSEIFGKKLEKIQHYEEIYKPLTDVLDDEKEAQEKADSVLAFSVEPVFDKEAFVRQFEKYIDQRGRGNFRGKSDGMKKLIEILDAHDLKDAKSTLRLISEIMDILNFEQIEDKKIEVDLDKQLLVSRSELYDFLFSIDFVDVSYNLRFNGKELSEDQFSPGEKGAMLLIFYLLIEKGKVPLIIDQPEENLDNESVFDLLVPYIRRAKKERQVILVTHNPNLAVVCDAEQIIHTTMNKKKSTIRYAWGSLEDVSTNKRVSAVLEGTLPAFDVRNSKYYRK